jgi:hypothetical protein
VSCSRNAGDGYQVFSHTSIAGPLVVLPGAPAAATIVANEDIDGGPLGVLSGAPAAATIVVDEDIDGGPLGVLSGAPAVATIVVDEGVDAGPPAYLSLHRSMCQLLQKRSW